MEQDTSPAKMRIDKWLWHARFFRTRSLAAKAVDGGHCRVNRERIKKSGYAVRVGDVLTFAQGQNIRVIKIQALADRRGSAPQAVLLYEDLDPPSAKPAKDMVDQSPKRDAGAGRPTKRERREMEKVRMPL